MPVEFLLNTLEISLGMDHTCAIWKHNRRSRFVHGGSAGAVDSDNEVMYNLNCFGSARYMQSSDLVLNSIGITPISVSSGAWHNCYTFKQILNNQDATSNSNVVLKESSLTELACFGLNLKGQVDIPTPVSKLSINIVSCGGYHTCVIYEHSIACWGANEKGQSRFLDNNYTRGTPVWISTGQLHSCAVFTDAHGHSKAQCIGYDSLGQVSQVNQLHSE